jgi:superoxide dismutase, Fe-Mn family
MTMEIHHSKHHAGYVNNLNKAIAGTPLEKMSLENILKNISEHPAAVRNNGGGHYNHSLFWKLMKPSSGGSPAGKLAEAVNASFNSFEEMKNRFSDAAKSVFGSGWAWLVLDSGKLKIGTTANQDNPLMNISELKGTPILALDVWEHAYYLKHMNKRADYISSWWNVVNWEFASELFGKAK